MANPNQVAGRAKVRVDGVLYATSGDTTLEPGGDMREGVDGDYEAGAFKVGAKPSKLTFSALTKAGFNAVQFGAIADATVQIEFDNGASFVIHHAWSDGPPAMTTDGKAACVLNGPAAEQVR